MPTDERVLAAFANAEDAAVYQIDAEQALVVSIDVITPLVDDPYEFGAIGAANALSDIYAMGGEGLMCLSFLATPTGFPTDITREILRGGAAVAMAAAAPILGGHSIEGRDLLFGVCAVGRAHPKRLFLNNAVRAGDILILTKPLGTGTLMTARKRDFLDDAAVRPAIDAMLQTNRAAVAPLHAAGVRATTDISGFGLAGHAAELAAASQVALVFDAASVPAHPHARAMLAQGVVTRANPRNATYAAELGPFQGPAEPLLFDPQTSGGLLCAVPPDHAEATVQALRHAGYLQATRVGEARAGAGLRIE